MLIIPSDPESVARMKELLVGFFWGGGVGQAPSRAATQAFWRRVLFGERPAFPSRSRGPRAPAARLLRPAGPAQDAKRPQGAPPPGLLSI
jgi:hypothetical protein